MKLLVGIVALSFVAFAMEKPDEQASKKPRVDTEIQDQERTAVSAAARTVLDKLQAAQNGQEAAIIQRLARANPQIHTELLFQLVLAVQQAEARHAQLGVAPAVLNDQLEGLRRENEEIEARSIRIAEALITLSHSIDPGIVPRDRGELETLRKENKRMRNSVQKRKRERDDARTALERAEEREQVLLMEVSDIQASLTKVTEEKDALHAVNMVLEQEKTSLERSRSAYEGKGTQIKKLQETIEQKNREITEFEGRIRELQVLLAEKNARLVEIKSEY